MTVKKIFFRTLIGIGFFLLFLFLLIFIVLKFPAVQTYITHKITTSISSKTHSEVRLGKVDIRFPKSIVLKEIFLDDLKKDTLFYAQEIAADVDMFALLSNTIELNSVNLTNITGHISRSGKDSLFNFDFILRAMAGENKGTEPENTDTAKAGWKFNLEDLTLKNIYLTFNDSVSGIDLNARLGEFEVGFKKIDPARQIFDIDKVKLENTQVAFLQTKQSVSPDTASSPMPGLSFDKINISNVKFSFENEVSGQQMAYEIKNAVLDADKIDLPNQIIHLNEITVSDSKALLALNKIDKPAENSKQRVDSTKIPTQPQQNWEVRVERLKLENNSFKSDDFNAEKLKQGMDYRHLFFSDLNADVKNLFYSASKTTADVKNISVKEQSGFELDKFKAQLTYDTARVELANLEIKTPGTHIKKYLKISHLSLKNISASPGDAVLNVQLTDSKIQLKDILFFQPALSQQPVFAGNENGILSLNTTISGPLKNLDIHRFILSTAQNTFIEIKGNIKNLPDAQHAFYDLTIEKITTGKDDINQLAKSVVPPNINLPTRISMEGFFKGTMTQFDSKLVLGSTAGGMFVLANMKENNKQPLWSGNFKVMSLDLGYILKDTSSTFGKLSLKGDIKGSGLKKETINADINLKLDSAQIKNYTYHDLTINGKYAQERFSGTAAMLDSNLAFTFDGSINMKEGNSAYVFTLDLKGADLRALHFRDEDFRVRAKIETDLRGTDMNTVNGKASVKNVLIITKGKTYPVESLLFASINEKRKSNFNIESSLINAKLNGTIALGEIGKEINSFINNYFTIEKKKPVEEPKVEQQFAFEIEIKKNPVINEVLLPQLTSYTPGPIRGSYDSEKKSLQLDISFPQITYGGNKIDSLNVNVHSDAQKIYYDLSFSNLSGGSLSLARTALSGKVEKDSINIILDIKGDNNMQKLLLAGQLKSVNDKFRFNFTDRLVIRDASWDVPESNFLEFGTKEIYVHNLNLEKNEQLVSVNSREDKINSPLDIVFKHFELGSLSGIVEKDSALFRGKLDGFITLQNIFSNMSFISDLKITDFGYKGGTLGNIAIAANNTQPGRYDVNVAISGNENKINLAGYYVPKDTASNLNLTIDLANVNLASIESFTNGQITRAKGNLTGNFKITGTTRSPQINGEINFKDAGFHEAYVNNYLTLRDEKIKVDPSGIYFPSFVIRDSLNNEAILSGNINTQDQKNLKYNLDLEMNSFTALNTTKNDNELFFGNIVLDSRVKVRGTQLLPVIDITAKVLDHSSFTIIIPQERYTSDKGEGVVDFIDPTQKINPIMTKKEEIKSKPAEIKGLDFTAQLEINKNSALKILVDPTTGDSLSVKGNATLSFSIDPSGKMSLTGNYEITEGSYRVSLNELVRKSFLISPGSTINWNGDIMDAEVSIDAVYNIKTSPIDLVANEIAGLSEEEKNTYRGKIPFEVILHMEGPLLKPDIRFEITMPPEERGALGGTVYAKLNIVNQDESELNKQVFALLVLNRFVQQDPLATMGGGSATETVARESVSKILSQQLNKFSDQLIKGVEINFDVQSYDDYSTGQSQGRTEVNYAVKKQFNDKLSVQVGGSVDVEGERSQSNKASDLAGDVILEYKITDDGRYRLKVFRKNLYENIFEGDIVETGAGLVYLRDYDKWKELFRKPEKNEEVNAE